jgi:MATE family multidrug resistance protein
MNGMGAGSRSGNRLAERWAGRGGYREVLTLAGPLILSTGSLALQEFVDRMFLSWYSPLTIAAAMPSGILFFTILSLFIGTASYVNTFVAQYTGAGKQERIGASLWQGLYLSLVGAAIILPLGALASGLFDFIGHPDGVRELEAVYFRILCYGAVFPIANGVLGAFFTGRGKPWPVMNVNLLATAVNVVFNYLLIFGHFGFPELGIAGAAISTIFSGFVAFLVYVLLILRPAHRLSYAILRSWRLDRELMGRLLRYGFPNGVQFFIDVFGFTVFVLLIGRLGTTELAATNITLNINQLAFMPMIGLGMAISILVGQYVGEGNTALAQRSVYSGAAACFLYMGLIALAYVLAPDFFIRFFAPRSGGEAFREIRDVAVVLLRFVAVYSIFDTMNIVFASGIKGAGDTRFVMVMILVLSALVLVIPSYLVLEVFHRGIYAAWIFVTAYISLMGCGFLLRFLQGKWKAMRVI